MHLICGGFQLASGELMGRSGFSRASTLRGSSVWLPACTPQLAIPDASSPSAGKKHRRNSSWLDEGLILQANSFSREKAPWWFGSDVLPAAQLGSIPGTTSQSRASCPLAHLITDRSPDLLRLGLLRTVRLTSGGLARLE